MNSAPLDATLAASHMVGDDSSPALRIRHSVLTRDRQPCGRTGALDALVLDARLRQSLVCVRELGRAGNLVGAVECEQPAAAFASRWCGPSAVLPDVAQDPAAYLNALLMVLDRYPARVVIPAHDGTIAVLRAHRALLERHTTLALGSEDAMDIAVNKAATLAIARELRILVPRGVALDDPDEVPAALAETGLPAVVKPCESWVERDGCATRLAGTAVVCADEARRAVATIVAAGGRALMQQWLPGRREAISLFVAHGRQLARFAQVAQRMTPVLGGSSVLRESISLPADTASAAQRLVAAIGLEGYAEIEFRRDRDGRPVLMEINPRLSASVEVAVRSGVNFPRLLFAWAAGERVWNVTNYRTGVRMRWLGGDYYHLKEVLTNQGRPDVPPAGRAVRTFLLDFLRPAAYDYVDARDPRPAMIATSQMLAHMARRALGGHGTLASSAPPPGTPHPQQCTDDAPQTSTTDADAAADAAANGTAEPVNEHDAPVDPCLTHAALERL